ncbi:MAG: hypothetical protein LBL90_05750 [Prevotellaceae bacterium]|jgi:hypothetical protein|nr:hypothetical protein [Prevotellaceae bacterium]
MSLGKYIINLVVCLFIPYILGLLLLLLVIPQYYFTLYPCMLLVFVGLGLPFYSALKTGQDNQRKFFSRFMGNTLFKLFLSLIIILLYVALIKEEVISFVTAYLVFYMVLSVFEVKSFTRITKVKSNAE